MPFAANNRMVQAIMIDAKQTMSIPVSAVIGRSSKCEIGNSPSRATRRGKNGEHNLRAELTREKRNQRSAGQNTERREFANNHDESSPVT